MVAPSLVLSMRVISGSSCRAFTVKHLNRDTNGLLISEWLCGERKDYKILTGIFSVDYTSVLLRTPLFSVYPTALSLFIYKMIHYHLHEKIDPVMCLRFT